MVLNKIDIGTELGKGWTLFKDNMSLLIVAGLLATLVAVVTCCLLAGPMTAGMLLILERLMRNDPVKPQAGDVFKGFDFFVQTLLLVIIALVISFALSFIPVLGQLAGIAVGAVMMWAMMFVTYQKLTAVDALKKVFEYAKTGEFTMPLVFSLIAYIVSILGVIACGVGVFFTIPLSYCMLACCYQSVFGADSAVVEPEVIPPPPSDLRL